MKTAKWVAIRNGRGRVVAEIEMFWCASAARWVTIPDASRYREAS